MSDRKNLDGYKRKHKKHHRHDDTSSEPSASGASESQSSYEASWSKSGDSASYDSRSGSSSASGSSASSSEESEKRSRKSNKKDLRAKPTSEQTRTVQYHIHYTTSPGERFDSNGTLKHDGDWFLTVANERLEPGAVQHKQDLLNVAEGRCRELVTEVRVKNLSLTGCDHPINLELPTVKAYKGEEFCGKSHFCHRFQPNELTTKNPFSGTLWKREASKAATDYQKRYGLDAQNFDDHVQRPKGMAFSLMPKDSPVVVFHDADPANKKCKFNGKASKGFEKEGLVKMDRAKEEKYSQQAREQISQKLPHGDVTNKFAVRISGAIPGNRKESHRRWAERTENGKKDLTKEDIKKGAVRYESMADFMAARPDLTPDAVQDNKKTALANFNAQKQTLMGTIECDYILVERDKKEPKASKRSHKK